MDGELEAEDEDDADAAWDWAEAALAQSNATWLLVGGHYPIYSVGEHGPVECSLGGKNLEFEIFKILNFEI